MIMNYDGCTVEIWAMGTGFQPTLYWACDYISMLGLIHVSKRDPGMWWRYDMETFPALLRHCVWSPVNPPAPNKGAVIRICDVSLLLAWANGKQRVRLPVISDAMTLVSIICIPKFARKNVISGFGRSPEILPTFHFLHKNDQCNLAN